MIEKIQQQLNKYQWDATLVVAVSGGVDSVVLLHALRQHLPKAKLIVAHVNYHLREESDGDAAFVQALAKKYEATFESIDWLDIPEKAIESQARTLRYNFFKQLTRKYQTQTVVVAHHGDDQAETVLLKLIRGGKLSQLTGMHVYNQQVVRPFLSITKQEIISYAQQYQLSWREDFTNSDTSYTPRNYLRHEILPAFKKINPEAVAHINDFAQQLQRQNDLIAEQTKIYVQTISHDWTKIPEMWLEPAIVDFIQQQGVYRLKQAQIMQIMQLLKNQQKPVGRLQLSKNIEFVKEYQQLYVKNATEMTITSQVLSPIMLKLNQWQIFANYAVKWTDSKPDNDVASFSFKLAKPVPHLYLRPVATSDKLALIDGHKKLRRLAIDEKLSIAERQDMMVLTTTDDIIVAVKIRDHWRVSAEFTSKQDAKLNLNWLAWRIEEK